MVKKHTLWSWKDIVKLNIFSCKGQLQVLITKHFMGFMSGFVRKMNV